MLVWSTETLQTMTTFKRGGVVYVDLTDQRMMNLGQALNTAFELTIPIRTLVSVMLNESLFLALARAVVEKKNDMELRQIISERVNQAVLPPNSNKALLIDECLVASVRCREQLTKK